MSEIKKINYDEIEQKILEKDVLNNSDHIILYYLCNKLETNIYMTKYHLSKYSKKEGWLSTEKHKKIEDEIKEKEEKLAKLSNIKEIKTIGETVNALDMMIRKNPNKFENYDYFLLEAIEDKLKNMRLFLKSKCLIRRFKKNDYNTFVSFKNIPFKKQYRYFYYSLQKSEKIANELKLYIIWTREGNSVNGLHIHSDRKKYNKEIKNFNDKLEEIKEIFNVWVNLPNVRKK